MGFALHTLALCSIVNLVLVFEKQVNILYLCITACPRVAGPLCDAFFVILQYITVSCVVPVAFTVAQLVGKPGQIIAGNALEEGRTGYVCLNALVHVTIPCVYIFVEQHGRFPRLVVRNLVVWRIVEEAVGAACRHHEGQQSQ